MDFHLKLSLGEEETGALITAPVVPVDLGRLPAPPLRGTPPRPSRFPTRCGEAGNRTAGGHSGPGFLLSGIRPLVKCPRTGALTPVLRTPILPRLLSRTSRRIVYLWKSRPRFATR
ncbi:Hypothetical protein AA314_07915 [Archangium gephyra]|uniref:Uncharacterized protein n=1 Tax=Archangium gephyra TaxID=48 RepID=A0AAC8QF28_9BACT|nr:Hypothetical protein AA314_07915 [Archangium gephyra]